MTGKLFAPEGPRRVALMRIGLGLILLCHAGSRWRYAVELYSTYGPAMPIFWRGDLPPRVAVTGPQADLSEHIPPVDASEAAAIDAASGWPMPSPQTAVLAHSLLLFLLMTATLGWQTRTSLVLAALLLGWLGPLDVAGTFAKPLAIGLHLLVLLALSDCGRTWSIDARLVRPPADFCRLTPAWPRRLMQLLVCAIYLGAAMTKLHTPAFLTGDLLAFSLLDDHWGGDALGRWMSAQPRLLGLLSLATLLFELLFPILIWVRRLRLPMLAAAFTLHAAMGLVMHLSTFSPTMFVALLAFLREGDLQRLGLPSCGARTTSPASSRRPTIAGVPATCLYIVLAVVVSLAGSLIQRDYDWYGAFGRRPMSGVVAFEDIPPAEWAEMQAARQPAWEDFVHRIAIGSRTDGRQVSGSSSRFASGQRVYVLVQFLPQHPGMLLEGLLIAPEGLEVARFSHRVAPDYGYALNGFELTEDLPPGPYRIVLQVEGFEFAERAFDLAE